MEAVIVPIASSDVPLVAVTAGLAIVTFALAIAAFWSARLSAREMKRNYLPIMIPGRPDGITRDVTFISADRHVRLENAETYADVDEKHVYLAFLLRNIGSGVAILNAVDARPKPENLDELLSNRLPPLEGLARAPRAVYLGPGEAGYVRLVINRQSGPPSRDAWGAMEETIPAKSDFLLDLLYSDLAGKQLTVSRVEFDWATNLNRYVARSVRDWRPRALKRRQLARRIASTPF